MEVGHRLAVVGSYADSAARGARAAAFLDYLARLTLSGNGHAWGEGVRVQPPDGALFELLHNGTLHPSLVEEPRAA